MTVQQAEDNSRILHVEIHSDFEEKVASQFYAVLLTLLSGTTGKMQHYLKVSIKFWSSCWNNAKLAYKTLVWAVKKPMGRLGKKNEKVLFIAKKKKISIRILCFNLLTKLINPYISGCSQPQQEFELDQTFSTGTLFHSCFCQYLWENSGHWVYITPFGSRYTVQLHTHFLDQCIIDFFFLLLTSVQI